jgi:hypothetical protein
MRWSVVLLAILCGVAVADDAWTKKVVARGGEIGKKVSKLRGLKIKKPIAMGVMTEAELRTRILTRLDEDSPPAERAAEAAMVKRWGVVPWDLDLDQLTVDLLTEQIAGFYDPTEKKLYVADKPEGGETWADMLMAHEIVHALQDQHFDLEPWMKQVEDDGDASAARSALVEGDGVALMLEYTLAEKGVPPPWSNPAVIKLLTGSMDPTSGGDLLARSPLAIRQGLMFPYVRGLEFVAFLRRTQPWSKVDDAFRRPPRSTEQILHPELYLADEKPHVITPVVPAGHTEIHRQVWGEVGWSMFLETHGVAPGTAMSAAAGWGGDRVLLVARAGDTGAVKAPERTTGLALITFDTALDATEAWDALTRGLDGMVIGTEISTAGDHRRWLDAMGRITVAEKRGSAIAMVTGAALPDWRVMIDGVWTWNVVTSP